MVDLWCKRAARFASRRLTPLALAVLLVCGLSLAGCGILEDFLELFDALKARTFADDRIPSLTVTFDTEHGSGSPDKTWLVVAVSFTEKCAETADDPCEALANELAGIVFDEYATVDALDGLRVIILNDAVAEVSDPDTANNVVIPVAGPTFERSADHLVKSLTIEQWRKELFAEGNT